MAASSFGFLVTLIQVNIGLTPISSKFLNLMYRKFLENSGHKLEAARLFEAEEREIKMISKKAWGKRKVIKKKKLLDTPYESNIF